MSAATKKPENYSIFDVDGTVAPFTDNPDDTVLTQDFIDYVIREETKNPGSIIILTGREYEAAAKILKPVLDKIKLTVISSHGLVCHTPDGKVHKHPVMDQIKDEVEKSHLTLQQLKLLYPDEPINYEEKSTGVTVNINNVNRKYGQTDPKVNTPKADQILNAARNLLAPHAENTGLAICDEHGAIEMRPTVGKKNGFYYFIEQGLVADQKGRRAFFCDSLREGGTDLELATDFQENGQLVIQVTNGKETSVLADYIRNSPQALTRDLKDGFSPFVS